MPDVRDKNGVHLKVGDQVTLTFRVNQVYGRYNAIEVSRDAPLSGSSAVSPQYSTCRFLVLAADATEVAVERDVDEVDAKPVLWPEV